MPAPSQGTSLLVSTAAPCAHSTYQIAVLSYTINPTRCINDKKQKWQEKKKVNFPLGRTQIPLQTGLLRVSSKSILTGTSCIKPQELLPTVSSPIPALKTSCAKGQLQVDEAQSCILHINISA